MKITGDFYSKLKSICDGSDPRQKPSFLKKRLLTQKRPSRFDLTYVGEDGENTHRPVVIHRGIVSTMERFVAYLTEVYKGAFPTWLAPIQATIIPVSVEAHSEYAYEIKERLQAQGLRVEVDDRNEKNGLQNSGLSNTKSTLSISGRGQRNGRRNGERPSLWKQRNVCRRFINFH